MLLLRECNAVNGYAMVVIWWTGNTLVIFHPGTRVSDQSGQNSHSLRCSCYLPRVVFLFGIFSVFHLVGSFSGSCFNLHCALVSFIPKKHWLLQLIETVTLNHFDDCSGNTTLLSFKSLHSASQVAFNFSAYINQSSDSDQWARDLSTCYMTFRARFLHVTSNAQLAPKRLPL